MTVTHNNKLYHVTPLACRYKWRLTQVGSPLNSEVRNRDQMIRAGLGHAMEGK